MKLNDTVSLENHNHVSDDEGQYGQQIGGIDGKQVHGTSSQVFIIESGLERNQ